MQIYLSTVSRHLASKYLFSKVYFVSRTKYIWKKVIPSFDFSPATAHIWHEKLLNKQFLHDFWFFFHWSTSKVPTMQQRQLIKKMDYFLEKILFPPWGISVSQQIEMNINSLLWLKKFWKLMWWSITWERIHKYIRKIFYLQSLKINNGGIENQQISEINNVENHGNIRKWRAIEFFCEILEN